jgi:hypothetical protein
LLTPTPKQVMFHRAVARYDQTGFGGGRGPGKSTAGCHEALRQSLAYPGNKGVVVRRDLKDLRDTTYKTFRDDVIGRFYPELLPFVRHRMSPSMETTISLPHWRDRHGNAIESLIMWAQTKDADSLRSANLAWCFMDEATEVDEDFYLMIMAALGRHALPEYDPQAMGQVMQHSGKAAPRRLWWASNPGPSWCKRRFPVGGHARVREVEMTVAGETQRLSLAFIPALARDNPHLPADYEAQLRAVYPAIWVRRWLEGDWDAFEGMIFTEFSDADHVLTWAPDLTDKDGWTHYLCLDWGFRNPTAALMVSQDYDGCWWIWREHYAAQLNPAQHAPALVSMRGGLDALELIDYAAIDQSNGLSIREQFNALPGYDFSFGACTKRKNGPDGTIMLLKQLLADGMIKISPACPNLIRELKDAKWAEATPAALAKGDPPEVMQDKDDHCIDALFMALENWRNQPARHEETAEERALRIIGESELRMAEERIYRTDARTGKRLDEVHAGGDDDEQWGL